MPSIDDFLAGKDLNPNLMDDTKEAIKLGREAAYEKFEELDDQYLKQIASGKHRLIEFDKANEIAPESFGVLLDQTQEFELNWKDKLAQIAGCEISPQGDIKCPTHSDQENFSELVGSFVSGFEHGFAHYIKMKFQGKKCECELGM